MLVQMVDILQDTEFATHAHIINGTQMLRVFGQSYTSRMGNNGDVEFLGHEKDGEHFVDTAHPASIDLTYVDGARGQELLEDNAVLTHFAGGDADSIGAERVADGFVAENVVGGGGLFDEPGFEFFEVLHVFDCFGDGPDLDCNPSV